MKTIIVYYSFTKNNDLLAKELQSRLSCDILKIQEVRKRTGFTILLDLLLNRKPKLKDYYYVLSEYDQCIFIAPIWAGKIAAPMKAFLEMEKNHISRYSFITLCGGGNPNQKGKIADELEMILDEVPDKVSELWVKDLLPEDKKENIKFTSGYRMQKTDLREYDSDISEFLNAIADHAKVDEMKLEKMLH